MLAVQSHLQDHLKQKYVQCVSTTFVINVNQWGEVGAHTFLSIAPNKGQSYSGCKSFLNVIAAFLDLRLIIFVSLKVSFSNYNQ